MLGRAGETQFDFRFHIFGIPVRIHPFFWLMAAFVVWQSTRDNGEKFLGILCVLISILVHELGHALSLRWFGFRSEIVLHGMGGYATSTHLSTWRRIWVSFAGPLAGFLLYGLTFATLRGLAIGYPESLSNHAVVYCLGLLLWINLYWGLMNLVPCLPLDGGHIMEALVTRYFPARSPERVLQISILASGAVAIYALQHMPGMRFLLFMFGYFCAMSVIAYNEQTGKRF